MLAWRVRDSGWKNLALVPTLPISLAFYGLSHAGTPFPLDPDTHRYSRPHGKTISHPPVTFECFMLIITSLGLVA